jgi:threonine dehydrogenase-like Zn-dependent dehydrogenase
LQEKSVLLVGCGSVGSIIANSLASSGLGRLALSDPDRFCLDNLYRHSLDMLWDSSIKSQAIAASLRCKYPFTIFEHHKTKLLDFPDEDLGGFDLVIVAIGNSTHEFAFNEGMVANGVRTPVVYTWLEPNGIGGHAVLVGGDYQDGCHQCNFLIPGGEGERMLTPNLNFLQADQRVTKHLGSCGSLFLPYSELDASLTASLAAKLTVRFLLEETGLGKKVSWRGDLNIADVPDLKFSDRYYQFQSQLKELPMKNSLCKLCPK